MNRGIYLNVINPKFWNNTNEKAALQISNIYNKNSDYSELIEKLTEAVYNYNKKLKKDSAE
jgi:hypothetical protein